MTPHRITLFGEELDIRFNMATEIAYEEITGQPFSMEALTNQRTAIALYMAAIIAAKDDTHITIEMLMKEATAKDIVAIKDAVWQSLEEFASIPPTTKKAKKGKKESDSKN